MKEILKVFLPLIIFILVVVGYFMLPWVIIDVGTRLSPDPPKPTITYAEFPFRLEYEIDGKRVVDEDIFICEYDGVGMNEGVGKYRKWKGRLASGREKIVLLKIDEEQEIYYPYGSERYNMGDMLGDTIYSQSFPPAFIVEKYPSGMSYSRMIYSYELQDKYKIALISWDYTPPIVNTFE